MEDPTYRAARKQVKKKKGFYVHLAVYLAVGLFFFLMNIATDPNDMWFFFPMLPWLIGLAIHYLVVFGFPGTGILTEEWEKRELEQELYRRGYFRDQGRALPPEESPRDEGLDLNEPRRVKEKQKRLDEDELV